MHTYKSCPITLDCHTTMPPRKLDVYVHTCFLKLRNIINTSSGLKLYLLLVLLCLVGLLAISSWPKAYLLTSVSQTKIKSMRPTSTSRQTTNLVEFMFPRLCWPLVPPLTALLATTIQTSSNSLLGSYAPTLLRGNSKN